jgi:hypothetical protein
MSQRCYRVNISPRHGFKFTHIPTRRGSVFGGSVVVHYEEEYAPILDCVYEMAEQIATGNGWPVEKAIKQVCKDEGWTLLPTHKRMIQNRIADDRLEYLFRSEP